MNAKKVISLIEKEAKKRGLKPLYYRDEDKRLWIGQGTGIYRLDEDMLIPKSWREQNMGEIISAHEHAQDITPVNILIDAVYINWVSAYVPCRLFLANDKYLFAQERYIEPVKKDKGCWRYTGNMLFFINAYGELTAVIACLVNKSMDDYKDNFIRLADLIKAEGR